MEALTYQDVVPESAIDWLNPFGTHAICCFWLRRGPDDKHEKADPRVDRRTLPLTAVVGNSFYARPTAKEKKVNDFLYSAKLIWRALSWNPQIRHLDLVGSEQEQVMMSAALGAVMGMERLHQVPKNGYTTIHLPRRLDRVDYPIPTPEPPERFPLRHQTIHPFHGDNLSELHAELMAYTLRYGKPREDKGRLDLSNVIVEWKHPFKLGAYAADWESLDAYAKGEGETGSDYTYNSRFDAWSDVWCGQTRTKNWFPIWIPGDETHDDPPCLVGVYIRDEVITGIFRAHNYFHAWPQNIYLLKHFYEEKVGKKPKSVVIISLQGGLRTDILDQANGKVGTLFPEGRAEINDDAGSWKVIVDEEENVIVAQHLVNGQVAEEFRGQTEEAVRLEITKARAWPHKDSECGWLGAQIAKREARIR